uniref:trypsin n=1 Tax=Xiphophorus couchianus TaxID=32473 RepID=A0A3B5LV51_9TELE
MASIQVPEGNTLKHECGGFVVADQWVMTAEFALKVVLGVHSLSEAEDTKQTFDIMELHNHPDFSIENYDNDIALIKLDRPFNASDAVRAVELLRAGGTNPDTGAAVETAGWGSLDNLGSRPDKLKEVVIEVINRVKCRRTDYFGRKFTNNMICAHKVCREDCGDSGGPLLYNGVAVGITSNGGKKCGQIKKPGVYTIISHFTEWIDNTMGTQPAAAPQEAS